MTIPNNTFHYPPELFDLIIDTIPLLNKSKQGVVLFFKGAGIQEQLTKDIELKISTDKGSINKYDITRTILTRINQDNDKYLRERREILKRIVEFESFDNCWESDRLKAKGLVAEIRRIIDIKDSFTQMKQEKDKEAQKRTAEYNQKIQEVQKRKAETEKVRKDFYSLYSELDVRLRGLKLETVLNEFFKINDVGVREPFTRNGEIGDGIIEQIDGAVELESKIFCVEMKWRKDTISGSDMAAHLVRIYHRFEAHGIYISASGYSPAALQMAKESMFKNTLLILCDLQEFITILENEYDLKSYFRKKIHSAILEKEPFSKPIF